MNIIQQKREQLLRLRSLRYRQTPSILKRVKAHAIRREPSLLYSCMLYDEILPISREQDSADASTYMFICLCYVTISMSFLRGYTFIIDCKYKH